MSLLEEQHAFYSLRVPEQFNRTLEAQRAAARRDEAAARLLDEMEAVRASIVVEVDHTDGDGDGNEPDTSRPRHVFDIDRGQMRVVRDPARTPFMMLCHRLSDFPNLRRECGDSLLGFLGGLAGIGDEMRLTSQRVRSLRELDGSLVFERTGHEGFTLRAHFGSGPPSSPPRATLRIGAEVYQRLRSGELDPQDAFLDGLVEIDGDVEMAIGLALTAVSPD